MNKILSKRSAAVFAALSLSTVGLQAADPNLGMLNTDPFFYTADESIPASQESMMQDSGRPETTHSLIPHLPAYIGFMNTNFTYRFITVAEQVMTMLGEGKHGLWRMQEAGTIREYLKNGETGLPEGANLLDPANLDKIQSSYSSYERPESWGFYRYPDEKVANGQLNYIDLPITHPKYTGKYADHKPIELPSFYCTMSENDYPHALEAMTYIFAQPGANVVGPLGKRAGLDVKENYTNIVRLTHLPDARSWANIGQEGLDSSYVNWQAVDTSKTNAEYYLAERPFFNHPYLFVIAVYDNKNNNDFRYVRPEGPYYESLKTRNLPLKTNVTQAPRFNILKNKDGKERRAGLKKVVGLPVYGVHHPDRASFGGGGACPLKGGDWGRYPETSGGSAWPTQYEEITPLCDGVLVDIKFTANLDGTDWNDPGKYLANAGKGSLDVTYRMQPGTYGVFTDPYNVNRGATNRDSQPIPEELTLHYPNLRPAVSFVPSPSLPTIYASNSSSSKSRIAGNNMAPAGRLSFSVASSGMSPVGTSCKPIMQQ